MAANGRIEWVDTLKGLGIVLVVLGHNSGGEGDLYHFLYTFHMPLFFMISGFLFSEKPVLTCLRRSSRHLMLPYVLLLGAYLIWQSVTDFLMPGSADPHYLRNASRGGVWLTGPLAVFWFVGVLWMAQNLYNLIRKLHPSGWWLLLLFAAAHATLLLRRPWVMCVNAVPLATAYLWLGHLLRGAFSRAETVSFGKSRHTLARLLPIAAVAVYALLWIFRDAMTMNIKCNDLGIPGVSVIAAVAGSLATAVVAVFLHRLPGAVAAGVRRVLTVAGRHSMAIMYLHMPVRFYIVCGIWPDDFPLAGFLLGLLLPLSIALLPRRVSASRSLG